MPRHATNAGHREEDEHHREPAEPEDGPVGIDAAADLDSAHGTDRHRRRCERGDHDGERSTGDDGNRGPAALASAIAPGPAPIERDCILVALHAYRPAERLADQNEAGDAGDRTECRERQRDRAHRLLRVEHVDRGRPIELGCAGIGLLVDRLLDRGHVGVAVAQHEAVPGVVLETLCLLDECRREQHERRAVGVVLHDLLDEDADADDRRLRQQTRLRVRLERRILEVCLAHGPKSDLLAHVVAVAPGRFLVDRDLASLVRVGSAAVEGREHVLVEVAAVDAAERLELLGEVRVAVDPRRRVERDIRARARHLREVRDLVHGVVALGSTIAGQPADDDRHRRRVGRAQEPWIRGLRAPRTGEGEQRQSADEAEEQRNARETAPPTAERYSRPVRSETHGPPTLSPVSFRKR